jgi:hypothetical protein
MSQAVYQHGIIDSGIADVVVDIARVFDDVQGYFDPFSAYLAGL